MNGEPAVSPPIGLAGLALGVAAVASVAWPLATYTLTLGLFGAAHVLSELRYVDLRFGARIGSALGSALLALLLGIVAVRLGWIGGALSHASAIALELGLGLGLVALVLPALLRARPLAGMLGGVVALVLAVAILVSAPLALLAIAVLHNFTPIAFVLEATRGSARRRAALLISLVFVAVPVAIAVGQVWAIVHPLDITAPEASPLGYGPLQDAMAAYLPATLVGSTHALHLFSACVFLQCAHYVVVLLVLPRLLDPHASGRLRWPKRRAWIVLLVLTTLAVFVFALDFGAARRGYGVLAAVHAWVELPILLLALTGLTPVTGRSRTTLRS